jgi:hypothetical protein
MGKRFTETQLLLKHLKGFMKTSAFISLLLAVSCISIGFAEPELSSNKPLLVIGQDSKSISDFFTALEPFVAAGDISFPDGIMAYTAISDLRGLSEPVDHGAGVNYVDELLKKYPTIQIVQLGLYMRYALDDIARGLLDNNIDELSQWIERSGKQVYLRIGYEFDNPENDYDPQQYILAYRRIVNRLRKNGLTNVYFVWHTIAWKDKDWPAYQPLQWYPGDEYVDWIGISFFDAARTTERNIATELARDKNKPLMIAESSPFNQYTVESKVAWLQSLFNYVNANNVRFISYINVNWDALPMFSTEKWGDARLQNDPILMDELLKHIKQ